MTRVFHFHNLLKTGLALALLAGMCSCGSAGMQAGLDSSLSPQSSNRSASTWVGDECRIDDLSTWVGDECREELQTLPVLPSRSSVPSLTKR